MQTHNKHVSIGFNHQPPPPPDTLQKRSISHEKIICHCQNVFKNLSEFYVIIFPAGSTTIGLIYLCETWWRLNRHPLYVHDTFIVSLQTYETAPDNVFVVDVRKASTSVKSVTWLPLFKICTDGKILVKITFQRECVRFIGFALDEKCRYVCPRML